MVVMTMDRNGTLWYITDTRAKENLIGIQKANPIPEEPRWYRVAKDYKYEFTYKIMKTQIKAIGGVEGLFDHFKGCIDSNFAMESWVWEPLKKIYENVKVANV